MLPIRSFSKIVFLLLVLSMLPLVLMAQTGAADESVNVMEYIASIPGLAALVLLVTQFVKKTWLKQLDGTQSIILVAAVSLILSIAAWLLQVGIFVGITWYIMLLYGAAAGAIATGLFDWKVMKTILEILKLLPTGTDVQKRKF